MNVFARCLVASTLVMLGNMLFNGVSNDAIAPILPMARDLSTVCGAVAFVACALAAKFRPQVLNLTGFSAAAIVCVVIAHALVGLGVANGSEALIAVGMGLSGIAGVWCTVVWLLACSAMDARHVCLCLALACCLGIGLAALVQLPGSYVLASIADAIASVVPLVLTVPVARPVFDRLASLGVPADHEISRPATMLPFSHRLFVSIFAFSAAFGFGLCYGPEGSDAVSSAGVVLAMAAVGVLAWRGSEQPRVDTLFACSFAIVLTGFLGVLVDDARLGVGVSGLLVIGYNLFNLLMWYMLATIAARNTVDAIPAVSWGAAVSYAGIFVGAQVGKAIMALSGDRLPAMLAMAAAIAGLVVYMLWSSREFSFDATISGVEPESPVVEVRYTDALADACARVSREAGLTERETEVMLLLARGNNATRICEELCITRNTVKYHARNIYDKLGVHSQQEVIDLVS